MMKSMKSLTMKQRLKVCAIMLWRVLFELCVDIPVGTVMYLVLFAMTAFSMLRLAILDRDSIGDEWEIDKGIVSNALRGSRAGLKRRFDVKLLVNQILEKEFPDEEEP